MTEASRLALENLRTTDDFSWYVVVMFAFVVYVYANEIQRRDWNVVLAGLAFYGLEWFIELVNALWLHFSQHAALWTAPGDTAFLITVGLNFEISVMFAVAGVAFVKMLPSDPAVRILGIPNRIFFAITNSVLCVAVEVVLNQWGVLVWEYAWWSWPNVSMIVIFGYSLYMFFSFWVFDHPSLRTKVVAVLAVFGIDAVAYAIFMGWLGWV